MEKILYLIKMGCNYKKNEGDMIGSDVGNYRIRGTFHDNKNNLIFIEFGNGCKFKDGKMTSRIKLRVDHQFNASIDWDENKSHIKINYDALDAYNYTKKDILQYIFNNFGVKFDNLELIDRSFCDYEYSEIAGDEFQPDFKAIDQAKKIYNYFYKFEKEIEKKKYVNFSMYYENNKLTVLKHYSSFNDKIIIDDIYNFDFDYKIPNKKEVMQ